MQCTKTLLVYPEIVLRSGMLQLPCVLDWVQILSSEARVGGGHPERHERQPGSKGIGSQATSQADLALHEPQCSTHQRRKLQRRFPARSCTTGPNAWRDRSLSIQAINWSRWWRTDVQCHWFSSSFLYSRTKIVFLYWTNVFGVHCMQNNSPTLAALTSTKLVNITLHIIYPCFNLWF
jgi:hypothetical protein